MFKKRTKILILRASQPQARQKSKQQLAKIGKLKYMMRADKLELEFRLNQLNCLEIKYFSDQEMQKIINDHQNYSQEIKKNLISYRQQLKTLVDNQHQKNEDYQYLENNINAYTKRINALKNRKQSDIKKQSQEKKGVQILEKSSESNQQIDDVGGKRQANRPQKREVEAKQEEIKQKSSSSGHNQKEEESGINQKNQQNVIAFDLSKFNKRKQYCYQVSEEAVKKLKNLESQQKQGSPKEQEKQEQEQQKKQKDSH